MKKNIFLLLAVIGFIAPYYFFLQVPVQNGFDLPLLLQPLLANNLMRGLAADLTITVIVFWVFVLIEANRLQMKNAWAYLLATFLVGFSFSLPLFLYFRARKMELG